MSFYNDILKIKNIIFKTSPLYIFCFLNIKIHPKIYIRIFLFMFLSHQPNIFLFLLF